MIIAVCGSLQFARQMREMQKKLQEMGHTALVPKSLDLIELKGFKKPTTVEERLKAEAAYDFIREHFRKIEKSDAILVVNLDKKGIKGYIGGNTFLEMGIAFYLGKKIYLLNAIPDMDYAKLEMHAMHPIVLKGNLSNLPSDK